MIRASGVFWYAFNEQVCNTADLTISHQWGAPVLKATDSVNDNGDIQFTLKMWKYWLRFHPQGVHHKLGESFQMILHFQFKVLTVWERTQGRLTHHFSCYMEKSSLQRAFFSEASFSVVRNCQYSLDRGTKLAVKKNVYLNVSIWIDIIQVASGTAGLLFENTYTQAHTVL